MTDVDPVCAVSIADPAEIGREVATEAIRAVEKVVAAEFRPMARSHRDGVQGIYAAAWGCCVKVRLVSVNASPDDVAKNRVQSRVAARLTGGRMDDMDAVALDAGPVDEQVRNQLAVSTVLYLVAGAGRIPTEIQVRIRNLCMEDGVPALKVIQARELTKTLPDEWASVRRQVGGFGLDPEEEVTFNRVAEERFSRAQEMVAKALEWRNGRRTVKPSLSKPLHRPDRFVFGTSGNLYNSGYPKTVSTGNLRHADIDEFVAARLEELDEGVAVAQIPMMLGRFPHLPVLKDSGLADRDPGPFGDISKGLLAQLSEDMSRNGFHTIYPVVDQAIHLLGPRLAKLEKPPSRNDDVVLPDLPGVVERIRDLGLDEDGSAEVCGRADALLDTLVAGAKSVLDRVIGTGSDGDDPLAGLTPAQRAQAEMLLALTLGISLDEYESAHDSRMGGAADDDESDDESREP